MFTLIRSILILCLVAFSIVSSLMLITDSCAELQEKVESRRTMKLNAPDHEDPYEIDLAYRFR